MERTQKSQAPIKLAQLESQAENFLFAERSMRAEKGERTLSEGEERVASKKGPKEEMMRENRSVHCKNNMLD